MKTITINNRTLLFVEVPEDATDIKYFSSYGGAFNPPALVFKIEGGKEKYTILPEDKYKFTRYRLIATTDTITEEQADKIIERSKFNKQLYRNYQFEGVESFATDGFTSLLRTHSITGRHAIIEVI